MMITITAIAAYSSVDSPLFVELEVLDVATDEVVAGPDVVVAVAVVPVAVVPVMGVDDVTEVFVALEDVEVPAGTRLVHAVLFQ